MQQKNDQHRCGCGKRCGLSVNPNLDFVDQVRALMRELGLEPRHGCEKLEIPSEHCRWCPPLFLSLSRTVEALTLASSLQQSRFQPWSFEQWVESVWTQSSSPVFAQEREDSLKP